jgi:hypothetical protein
LGDFARGRAALAQIGETWFQDLRRFLAWSLGKADKEARNSIRTRNTQVLEGGACGSWFRRLRGLELRAP